MGLGLKEKYANRSNIASSSNIGSRSGRFMGTDFVPQTELDKQATQKRSLATIQEQGKQLRLNTAMTEGGATERQNIITGLNRDKFNVGTVLDRDKFDVKTSYDKSKLSSDIALASDKNWLEREKFQSEEQLLRDELDFRKTSYTEGQEKQSRTDYAQAEKDWYSNTYDQDGNLLSPAHKPGTFPEAWRVQQKAYDKRNDPKTNIVEPEEDPMSSPVQQPTTRPVTTGDVSKKKSALRLGSSASKVIPVAQTVKTGLKYGAKLGSKISDRLKRSETFRDMRNITGR